MMGSALRKIFGGGGKAKKARRAKITYGPNFMSISPEDAEIGAAETSKKIQDLWNRVVYNMK